MIFTQQILVNIIGISLIGLIYLFFFGKKEEKTETFDDEVTIKVQGGYKPSTIRVQKDKPVTLTFIREDNNSCLEEVNLPDFKIKTYLPFNQQVSVTVTPKHNSQFYCGMNMYRGKIIVSE